MTVQVSMTDYCTHLENNINQARLERDRFRRLARQWKIVAYGLTAACLVLIIMLWLIVFGIV